MTVSQSHWNDHSKQSGNKDGCGMLAGHCRNVIVASVKQGEVKKQERAVLYLADYPHASSRLQGERADSLNRQEQAEHGPHNTCSAETHTHIHTFLLPLTPTEHKVLFLTQTSTQTG